MTKVFIHYFCWNIYFSHQAFLHALEVIEILGGKASQIPIAVMPFKSFGAPKRYWQKSTQSSKVI